MDKIVDHLLIFEGEGKIKDFIGSFTEYRDLQAQNKNTKKSEPTKPTEEKQVKNTNSKRKLSFKEQKELENIEKEMPVLKEKQDEILEKLNNETDYNIISELSQQLEKTTNQLEAHEMRWLELQEILE